jgi:folate-binding protein YgfZ
VSADAVEVWRIHHGRARMGRDFDRSSLPAEAGLLHTIDQTKGCFLGQESVARVRNLGHPPRVLLHLLGDGRIDVGEPLLVAEADVEVGAVTSAARLDGSTVVLARVGWSAREEPLRTANGLRLSPARSPD